ncbi:hypothetical protein E2C01_037763 [Portunus trituberculatus]|uniref:Uncharacterized protein n=1 Tax=Portunus trituberculatus TaxID=210409 RepID=A0A5B7FFU2_PORTR|nr:hypothetical protein [Portunus trituberculatus]
MLPSAMQPRAARSEPRLSSLLPLSSIFDLALYNFPSGIPGGVSRPTQHAPQMYRSPIKNKIP